MHAVLSVYFAVLADQWPSFLVMAMIVILSTMINMDGLDLSANGVGDYDWDLKGIGAALMLGGFMGGFLGHTSVNRSIIDKKAGANSWLSGIWAAGLLTFDFHPARAHNEMILKKDLIKE